MSADEHAIQSILSQTQATREQAIAALNETNGDSVEAIAKLWNLSAPTEKPKTEWDLRRDVCSAYEKEMENYVSKASTTAHGIRTIAMKKDIKNQ